MIRCGYTVERTRALFAGGVEQVRISKRADCGCKVAWFMPATYYDDAAIMQDDGCFEQLSDITYLNFLGQHDHNHDA